MAFCTWIPSIPHGNDAKWAVPLLDCRRQCRKVSQHSRIAKAVMLPPGPTVVVLTWACSLSAIPQAVRGPPAAFFGAALLANLSLFPTDAVVFTKLLELAPVAVCLLLLQPSSTSVNQRSAPEVRQLMIAFVIGAAGTTLGAILAGFLLPLQPEAAWQMASAFAATYIGGSVNYVGVVQALNIPKDLAAAGLAADMGAMSLYFAGLFSLASRVRSEQQDLPLSKEKNVTSRQTLQGKEHAQLVLVPVLVTACVAAFSSVAANSLTLPAGSNLMIMSGISLLLSRSRRLQPFLGLSASIGDALVTAFFIALGTTARLSAVAGASPMVACIAAVVLVVHALTMLLVGRGLFHLPLKIMLLASNANVGGATTAAAFAAAYGWRGLVAGAILAGTFGYLIGTPVALLLFHFFSRLQPSIS